MNKLSLFSGIGGDDLASEWAGIETICFVEIDKFCQKVLNKHWPKIPIMGDIRNVTKEKIREVCSERTVDIIGGGFPCQPFSRAGLQRGKEDDRYLWEDMCRVLSEIRPAWVVAENVAGLQELALNQVLSDLESLGYDQDTYLIPACAVGAWHRRDRIFIVAYDNCQRRGTTKGISEVSGNLGEPWDTDNQGNVIGGYKKDHFNSEPRLGRMVSRTTAGVDRLRGIGNSVMPMQIYLIYKAIVEMELLL